MKCLPDRPCMEPECLDCEGLRAFRGILNAFLIMMAASALACAVWFGWEWIHLWRMTSGHH
jgi:hypothetical protein